MKEKINELKQIIKNNYDCEILNIEFVPVANNIEFDVRFGNNVYKTFKIDIEKINSKNVIRLLNSYLYEHNLEDMIKVAL